MYDMKKYTNKPGAEANLLFYLIPTNLDNAKVSRYIRQTSFYLHFIITIPILLFICFMDPIIISYKCSISDVCSLHWADLKLSKNINYKFLVIGLSLGCGIFAVLTDLLFNVFW